MLDLQSLFVKFLFEIVCDSLRKTLDIEFVIESISKRRHVNDAVAYISAKTGTAEVGDGKAAHGWFVGFLNDEEHPYAFACIVENGGSGLGAAGGVINTVLQAAVSK